MNLAPSLPTQPKISPLSAKFFPSKKIPFSHSLAASSFLITPVHVELHQKIHGVRIRISDNDDEGDEFDFEPPGPPKRASAPTMTTIAPPRRLPPPNEEEYDDDDDDDNACEESWFLDNEGRKDVVVIVNDENNRPNDCNHRGNDTDISKAKGKIKAVLSDPKSRRAHDQLLAAHEFKEGVLRSAGELAREYGPAVRGFYEDVAIPLLR